jgi:hypothetical protein
MEQGISIHLEQPFTLLAPRSVLKVFQRSHHAIQSSHPLRLINFYKKYPAITY